MHTTRSTISGRTVAPVSLVSAALAVAAILPGCGGVKIGSSAAYPVKGKVLLASGQPLTAGKVIFLPKEGTGMTAKGEISSDGTFSLKTADDREGAPAGVYKVRIEPSASALGPKGAKLDPSKLPFAAIYMDEDGETGLTATVKAEATQLEPFKLVAVTVAGPASRIELVETNQTRRYDVL
jgi:hypothetical protein